MKNKMILVSLMCCLLISCLKTESNEFEQKIIGTWVSSIKGWTYIFNANGSGSHSFDENTVTFVYGFDVNGIFEMKWDDDASILLFDSDDPSIRFASKPQIFFSPDSNLMFFGKNVLYRK